MAKIKQNMHTGDTKGGVPTRNTQSYGKSSAVHPTAAGSVPAGSCANSAKKKGK